MQHANAENNDCWQMGYIPRSKGRPRKNEATEEMRQKNELAQLRMQVELLQNFLSEVGRR